MIKIITMLCLSSTVLALEVIDDNELSSIEGQSGITIEASLEGITTIGSISFTDNDGDGIAHIDEAGIYLSDISIGAGSVTSTIDITADGTLNLRLSDIVQGDLWVRNIAMGSEDTSFGAVGITNVNYDKNGYIDLSFSSTDDAGGILPAITYNINMASTTMDFTFVDEAVFETVGEKALKSGNRISYAALFTDFIAQDTKIYADATLSDDGREWIKLDMGSITGSSRMENIGFGVVESNLTQTIGSAGFSGINIENTSYMAISAH